MQQLFSICNQFVTIFLYKNKHLVTDSAKENCGVNADTANAIKKKSEDETGGINYADTDSVYNCILSYMDWK